MTIMINRLATTATSNNLIGAALAAAVALAVKKGITLPPNTVITKVTDQIAS